MNHRRHEMNHRRHEMNHRRHELNHRADKIRRNADKIRRNADKIRRNADKIRCYAVSGTGLFGVVSAAASSALGVRHHLIRRWCQTPPRPPLVSDTASSALGVRHRLIRRWCQTPPRPPLVSDAASSALGVRHQRPKKSDARYTTTRRHLLCSLGKRRPACTPDGSVFLCSLLPATCSLRIRKAPPGLHPGRLCLPLLTTTCYL
jgi:hypothetical protein